MEGNPGGSGMNTGNGRDPSSGSAWIWMNLPYFIMELCKIANVSTTENIFSQSVSERILQTFRQPQNELTRLQGLMRSLCDITGVPTDGEDICSQNFVDSFVEYVRQDLALVEGIRTNFAERQPFRSGIGSVGNHENQPPPPAAYPSDDQNSTSESSEIAANESNEAEVVEMDSAPGDVKVFPSASQIISIGSSSDHISPRPSSQISSKSVPQQIPSSTRLSVSPVTFHVPTPVPTATDTASSGNNHDNVTTTPPALSANLPEENRQSGSPSLEDFGPPQSGNEAEMSQTPLQPSTSRQLAPGNPKEKESENNSTIPGAQRTTKNDKRGNEGVAKKKIHANHGFLGDYYWCTCGRKFILKVSQKNHIKSSNAQWKFQCKEGCGKKFYTFSLLREHLRKRHKKKNALKDYKTGCTRCGIMFETKSQLINHQKTVHDIHRVARPRRAGMTRRQFRLATTQQNPRLCTQENLIENEVIDLASGNESGNEDEAVNFSSLIEGNPPPPPPPQMDLQPRNSGLVNGNDEKEGETASVETSAGLNGRIEYGECFGCILCTQAFRDLQQLREHLRERHQSNTQEVKCCLCKNKSGSGIICGLVFGSCKSFHAHRLQNHLN